MKAGKAKTVLWIPAAKKDLLDMPEEVRIDFGYGLYQAQLGEHPDNGKTLSGFGSASVIELVNRYKGNAYRAIYTVRFEEAIFVLHVFQKKSNKGIETPKHEIDLLHSRLKMAEQIYNDWKSTKGKK